MGNPRLPSSSISESPGRLRLRHTNISPRVRLDTRSPPRTQLSTASDTLTPAQRMSPTLRDRFHCHQPPETRRYHLPTALECLAFTSLLSFVTELIVRGIRTQRYTTRELAVTLICINREPTSKSSFNPLFRRWRLFLNCPTQICSGLLALLLLLPCGASSSAELVVAEPQSSTAPTRVSLTVNEDGLARLPLKWSGAVKGKDKVDFSVSTFKGGGELSALVGLGIGPSADGPLKPRLRQVAVDASGVEILLDASDLVADVNYIGQLTALVGQSPKLNVEVSMVRPAAMMPFRCPVSPQIVHEDGSIAVDFRRLNLLEAKAVDLKLVSPFLSPDNQLGTVGFTTPASGQALQRESANITLTGLQLVAPLRTVGLTEVTTYTGRIGFFIAGRQVMECALALMLPKLGKGELAVDSTSLTRNVMLPMWFCLTTHPARLSLRLFDRTRTHRIDNITAVLDGPVVSPNGTFDPAIHASFWVNGSKVPNFLQLTAPMQGEKAPVLRTIAAGEQLKIEMRLDRLAAGNHTFGLRFVGGNGVAQSPKVDVAVSVRHHWVWAVLAVIASLLLSFFLTRGIVNWRDRLRLRHRVTQLSKERFDIHNDIPCVAFLHVVLEQTTLLLERTRFLSIPSSVNDFLARAERVVTVMRHYNVVQEAVDRADCSTSVKDHYREAIAAAMSRIGPQPLDQTTADKVVQELDLVALHLAEDPYAWYRTHLSIEAKALLMTAEEVKMQLGTGNNQKTVDELLTTLKGQMPDETKREKVKEFDDAYWMVKLLVSRRSLQGANDAVIKAYSDANKDVTETFRAVDEWCWNRLDSEIQKGRVKVEPLRLIETQECLTPITFVLRFDDSWFDDSYFARNVLRYTWTFDLPPPAQLSRWRRLWWSTNAQTRPNLPLTLSGARVTQYASAPGDMKVSVKITLPGSGKVLPPIISTPILLKKNSELSTLSSLSVTESLSMTVVFFLTLATSLSTLYFAKSTFGSFSDYVAILVWAIGIDQGKNLIQMLKALPLDAPATGAVP